MRLLEETDLVRSVQFSDPDEFLNKKTNFYPAVLVDVETASVNDITLDLNFNVIIADELDGGKTELDSITSTMIVISRLIATLQRLSEDSNVQMTIDQISTVQRVYEASTTDYYGWTVSFVAQVPNTAHYA